MYQGIYAKSTGLINHYIQCDSENDAEEYIHKLNRCHTDTGQQEKYFARLALIKMKGLRCKACATELEYLVCWRDKTYCLDCLVMITNTSLNNLVISMNNYLEAETRRQRCLQEKFVLLLKASQTRLNNSKSKFIGIPREHRVSRLKVEYILHSTITNDNREYVRKELAILTDDQNNVYQWNTNNARIINVFEQDEWEVSKCKRKEPMRYEPYFLTFTIKAHIECEGIKQTVIERVSPYIPQALMKSVFRMLKEQT
jgi:transposase-like protein